MQNTLITKICLHFPFLYLQLIKLLPFSLKTIIFFLFCLPISQIIKNKYHQQSIKNSYRCQFLFPMLHKGLWRKLRPHESFLSTNTFVISIKILYLLMKEEVRILGSQQICRSEKMKESRRNQNEDGQNWDKNEKWEGLTKCLSHKSSIILSEGEIQEGKDKNSELNVEEMCKKRAIWDEEMEKLMLEHVSNGMSWKQIESQWPFKQRKMGRDCIKRRFQSDMRIKFRLLFRQAYRYQKEFHITDKTYKYLINTKKICSEGLQGKITLQEADILTQNIDFFRLPHWNGVEKNPRNPQSKFNLLAKLKPKTCIAKIVNAIINLQRALPQSKGFKLRKNCPRKMKKKTSSKESEQGFEQIDKDLQFMINEKCLAKQCFHNSKQFTDERVSSMEEYIYYESSNEERMMMNELASDLDHEFELRKDIMATFE